MTKQDIIEAIVRQHPRYPRRELERMVNTVFESMTEALARGEGIELRGFGSFVVRQRAARTGRNPRTRVPVHVTAKKVVGFKVNKDLRARVEGPKLSEAVHEVRALSEAASEEGQD